MKRLLSLLVATGLASSVFAEINYDESLIKPDDQWNLYTKLAASWCELGSDDGLWGSVEVGGILNDGLALGVRGTALLDDVEPGFGNSSTIKGFDAKFYGVNAEYTFYSSSLTHLSLGLFAGVGEVEISNYSGSDVDVAVVQPAFNVMINVTQTSELGLGLSYRYMDPDGGSSEGLDEGDFSGLDISLFLRLTEF